MTFLPTLVRVAVILLAVAGAAGHLTYLDALWWHSLGLTATASRDVSPATVTLLVVRAGVAIACSVLSVLMVLHEGRYPRSARALGAAFGAWSYLQAYPGATLLFRPPAPGMERELFEAHFLVVEIIGLVGLVRFSALFPRSLTTEELEPIETLPTALRPFHHAAVAMRAPWAPAMAGAVAVAGLWAWTFSSGGHLSDAGLNPVMHLVRFLAVGLVVMNLSRAWSSATEGDLDGLTWLWVALVSLLGTLALLIGGNVLVAVTGWPEPNVAWRQILFNAGLLGFFTALAMSVLHRHAIDPAVLIRRISTTAAVITTGLLFAAGLEALFGTGMGTGVSVRRGVGTAFSFAVILSTWRSLARMIERILPV